MDLERFHSARSSLPFAAFRGDAAYELSFRAPQCSPRNPLCRAVSEAENTEAKIVGMIRFDTTFARQPFSARNLPYFPLFSTSFLKRPKSSLWPSNIALAPSPDFAERRAALFSPPHVAERFRGPHLACGRHGYRQSLTGSGPQDRMAPS